ncbi:MAG: rhodanese-like domain-containing protein [Evtepia sp.]
MKKRMLWFFAALLTLGLAGCGGETQAKEPGYQQITAQEAKAMMDVGAGAVVLDVREQEEYDQGHIPGAVLLPVGEITQESASAAVPEKDTVVLVYCRSGNRSKAAANELSQLGYTQVYEFGGIQDWPYEIE